MISRRAVIVALAAFGAVAVPLSAAAQDGQKPRRIGFLGNSTPALEANLSAPRTAYR
jgi:hypothetical protein